MGPLKKERRYILFGVELGGMKLERNEAANLSIENYWGIGETIAQHKNVKNILEKLGMHTYTKSEWV